MRQARGPARASIDRMRARKDHLDGLAIGLLLVCCLAWAGQQILIKSTVAEVPPLWQAGLRFGGATVLLVLWCRLRHIPLLDRDGTGWAGLLSGLLFAAEFCCIYLGLLDTTASRVTVFLYTSPFWVALLLPRFVSAERLRMLQWAGLALAFGGVALAFAEGLGAQASGPHQLRGDALALAAGCLWGLTTLTIRSTRLGQVSAEKVLVYQVAVTAVVTPLASLAFGETWQLTYSGWAWTSITLQVLLGSFGSLLAWMWLLRHYPATHMSTFVFLTPLLTLVLGVGLLGEPLTVQLVLALCGVLAGIWLVNRRPPAPPAASATSGDDSTRA